MVCLPKDIVKKFIDALKDGTIDPDALSRMSSAERRTFFDGIVGKDSAKDVNALFESKLLLKDQQTGMVNWAREVAGKKPDAVRDMVSKINRMTDALEPKDLNDFKADLVSKKIGSDVTMDEARNIAKLGKDAMVKKDAIDRSSPSGSPSRMAYAKASTAMQIYLRELRSDNPTTLGENVMDAANVVRTVRMTGDLSMLLHQNYKMALSHPIFFIRETAMILDDLKTQFGGASALDTVMGEGRSRENWLNGNYRREGLAVGGQEEMRPSDSAMNIPGVGKILKANNDIYTAFTFRMRMDYFDKLQEVADRTGGDAKGIGRVVNALTGRGYLTPKADIVWNSMNTFAYPPRLLKSDMDVLAGGIPDLIRKAAGGEGVYGDVAAKEMALNMVKVIGGMAAIMTIANALHPGSAEMNPESSNFGKIKVGDTAFDFSGGMASVVTLAARLVMDESKSATTGKITKLNTGKFGSQTELGVVEDFLEGRATSIGQVFLDKLKGTDYEGDKPFSPKELEDALSPYILSDYMEAADDPKSAPRLLVLLGSFLGLFPSTETPYKKKKK